MRFGRKILLPFLLTAFCFLFVFGNVPSQESADEVFEKAVYYEDVQGDLQKAIGLYEQILKQFPENSAIAGKAQLHIGLCYEKLGKTEAIKAYELVLEKYSGQKELVAVARARLAQLKKEESEGLTITVKEMGFNVPEPFDLSPDGTKILGVRFRKGQNIVVSHLGKDKVDYITDFDWTDNCYWTYNPIWSPDGKEIVYLASYSGDEKKSDNNLSVSSLDGQARILISSKTDWFVPNAWMPDGTSILSIRGDEENKQELGLVPSEGGEFKKLISLQGQVERYGRSRATACVSPDGRFIAYTDRIPDKETDIYIISSDGKISWPLVKHPAADGQPRWSPDGKHIIFYSLRHGNWALWGVSVDEGKAVGDPFLIRDGMANNMFGNWTVHGLVSWNWVRIMDIFLMDVKAETGEPAGKPKQLDYTPTGANVFPEFAPEGNRLAFIRRDAVAGKAYLVVTQGKEGSAKEYEVPEGHGVWYLRWLQDGSGIGMVGNNRDQGNFLLKFRFDNEEWEIIPIPVSDKKWTRFEWSGNGGAFLYSNNGPFKDGAGIIEHNMETGEERYVYKPKEGTRANFRWLKYSRDHKKLAFLESNTRLTVVDLETGESHMPASEVSGFPSWSSDGQKIMCVGSLNPDNKGQKSILVFPEAGGPIKEYNLSKDLPRDSRIFQHDWSADGTKVVFVLSNSKSEHLIYKNIIPKDK